jgi:hypothetical protein
MIESSDTTRPRPTTGKPVHDLVGVGFGPANLALAAYIHEERRQHRAIADLSGTEAAMLVVHVRERETEIRLPALHQPRRRRPRAVVGHDHLKIAIGLARQPPQDRVERIFAVVGGDNHGDQIAHGRGPAQRA